MYIHGYESPWQKGTYFTSTKIRTHNHPISKQMYNQFKQFMFRDNSYKSRIISSLIMIKQFVIKIINN